MSTILVTGAAGFIGYHVAHQLLQQGAPSMEKGISQFVGWYQACYAPTALPLSA